MRRISYPGIESSYAREAARARLGTIIAGKWRLDELLGVGGTSAVYAGTHRNGNRAAIKLLRVASAGGERARLRLRREARAANRLAEYGAVSVLDDGIEGDELFLVMELLDGETLAARAHAAGGTLPLDEVLRIAEGILEVLAAAHERGIIHRDVKPENVFLTRAGAVRVLDFGLARVEDPADATDGLTASGVPLGTPAFMAPEQARGRSRDVGASTDVWGVGATLFTLLTGRFVHVGETAGEMLFLAGSRRAAPLATYRAETPSVIASVIDRALAFDAQKRFADAATMLSALRGARLAFAQGDRRTDVPAASVATLDEPSGLSARTLPRSVKGSNARALAGLALFVTLGLVAVLGTQRVSTAEPSPFEAKESPADAPVPTLPPEVASATPEVPCDVIRSAAIGSTEVSAFALPSPPRSTRAPVRLVKAAHPAALFPLAHPSPSRTAASAASISTPTPTRTPEPEPPPPPKPDLSSVEDLLDHRK